MSKLVLAIVLLAAPAAAQDPSERLASTARLWARIHYTHPWLAAKDIDWDRAFADAAPRVRAATSKTEYAAAVRDMLAALGDPATYLRESADFSRFGQRPPSFRREGDILVYDPGIGGPEPFQNILKELQAEFAKPDIKGLVIDARNSPSFVQRWSDSITPYSAPGLVSVSRRWSGYPPPPTAGMNTGYYHSLQSSADTAVQGSPNAPDKPLVAVAGEFTNTPASITALQIAGKAAIVFEGANAYSAVTPQTTIPLGEGLQAVVRTHEFTHADGTHGFVPQRVVESGGLEAAFEIVRQGITAITGRPRGFQLKRFVENPYRDQRYPAEGMRMLGALRTWSVFEYFFPYKHLIGEDWQAVLPQALDEARSAQNALEYHRAIARLVARTNDTHCFVSSPVLQEHWGGAIPPFLARWIEGRPVVTKTAGADLAKGIRAAGPTAANSSVSAFDPISQPPQPSAESAKAAMKCWNGPLRF